MFDSFKKAALVRLSLRYVRAHERLADAVCDIRDHLVGSSPVGINRTDVDERDVDITYSNDADTFARQAREEEHFKRFGAGSKEPFGI